MVAIRQDTEIIKQNGEDVEAVQIKVTVPGFASLFWSVKYCSENLMEYISDTKG
jgi:hypothetical protein